MVSEPPARRLFGGSLRYREAKTTVMRLPWQRETDQRRGTDATDRDFASFPALKTPVLVFFIDQTLQLPLGKGLRKVCSH